MRKFLLPGLILAMLIVGFVVYKKSTFFPEHFSALAENEEESESAESQEARFAQQFEQMRDPALGEVPSERLSVAVEKTLAMRSSSLARAQSLTWQERGPIYDFVGASGNSRPGGAYTAGNILTTLIDTLNDPTGNTVLSGSHSGGLWKCTNFLSNDPPNWQPVNDFMANLSISSICQNPVSPNIMYLATGEGFLAGTRVRGNGFWKSTDAGATWTLLPSTANYRYAFKIICDAAGNVYVATAGYGLLRSTDGGANFTLISPSGLVASNPTYVPDIELSTNGRLHAAFGYSGSTTKHYYTNTPATVTSASGWLQSTGLPLTGASTSRIELASQGNITYAVTCNTSNNVDNCFKSTDDGATWTKTNSATYTTAITNTQGWYDLTLAINPEDPDNIIVGGVDAYISYNGGATVSRLTYWVGSVPYVHADHHWMGWYVKGFESRVMIGCDGGMFLSKDGGLSWRDRNQNMGVKQFYSCAIHPAAGSNVLLAGAQDNGVHQITTPGKTFSTEVYGGDGCFVHINQQNPLIRFGSYVYNVYRRSVDGGVTWSSYTLSSSLGYFVNPFDYDDALNVMYASNAGSTANNQIRRWNNANTAAANTSITMTIAELTRNSSSSNATCFKVSPYTSDAVYIGGSTGKLLKLTDASTVTSLNYAASISDIGSTSFPTGYLNCINTGTNDQNLVATFTNYGVNNIWVTNNGGTTWTAIDGNLPDMPVWFATFEPGSNSRMIIGTETGVFTTDQVNGSSTVWTPNPGFPLVRTSMLKVRESDRTIVAATFGRGLWTAVIPNPVPITLSAFEGQLDNKTALLKWTTSSEQNSKNFDIEKSTDNVHFTTIGAVEAAGTSNSRRDYSFRDAKLSENNYYRLRMNDKDGKNKSSQVVLIKFNAKTQNVWVVSNPFKDRIDVRIAKQAGQVKLQLFNLNGSVIAEKNLSNVSGQLSWQLNGNVSSGTYVLRTVVDGQSFSSKLVKN